jgi:hypothetical protein
MPVYTSPYPETTLENDIREVNGVVNLNPYVVMDSQILQNLNDRIKVEHNLGPDTSLPDGKDENYKRQYYANVFSADTTAGYTQMKQTQFISKFGVISGYQIGVPAIR